MPPRPDTTATHLCILRQCHQGLTLWWWQHVAIHSRLPARTSENLQSQNVIFTQWVSSCLMVHQHNIGHSVPCKLYTASNWQQSTSQSHHNTLDGATSCRHIQGSVCSRTGMPLAACHWLHGNEWWLWITSTQIWHVTVTATMRFVQQFLQTLNSAKSLNHTTHGPALSAYNDGSFVTGFNTFEKRHFTAIVGLCVVVLTYQVYELWQQRRKTWLCLLFPEHKTQNTHCQKISFHNISNQRAQTKRSNTSECSMWGLQTDQQ